MTAEPWLDQHGEGAARQRRRRGRYRDLRQELAEITDRTRQEVSELRRQLKQLSDLLDQVRQQHDVLVERRAPPAWTLHLQTGLIVTFRCCTTCGTLKPLDDFYPRPDRLDPDRRHRQCKDCTLLKQQLRHERRTQRPTAAGEPS